MPAAQPAASLNANDEPEQVQRKPGGYSSRVEQILYENPNLSIIITDAGKSHESGGKPIMYTIRTGVSFNLLSHEAHI